MPSTIMDQIASPQSAAKTLAAALRPTMKPVVQQAAAPPQQQATDPGLIQAVQQVAAANSTQAQATPPQEPELDVAGIHARLEELARQNHELLQAGSSKPSRKKNEPDLDPDDVIDEDTFDEIVADRKKFAKWCAERDERVTQKAAQQAYARLAAKQKASSDEFTTLIDDLYKEDATYEHVPNAIALAIAEVRQSPDLVAGGSSKVMEYIRKRCAPSLQIYKLVEKGKGKTHDATPKSQFVGAGGRQTTRNHTPGDQTPPMSDRDKKLQGMVNVALQATQPTSTGVLEAIGRRPIYNAISQIR